MRSLGVMVKVLVLAALWRCVVLVLFALGSLHPRAPMPAFATAQSEPVRVANTPHNTAPGAIVRGPDGNLYFSEPDAIGRISPRGAVVTFPAPGARGPDGLTLGGDDQIWFISGNALKRMSSQGRITALALPLPYGHPDAIVRGPGGALWITFAISRMHGNLEYSDFTVARLAANGALTRIVPRSKIFPDTLIASRGPRLWFTMIRAIGNMTATGVVTLFPIPRAVRGVCRPDACRAIAGAEAPDGSIWFTIFDRAIGRLDTRGHFTYYSLRKKDSGVPFGIVYGPDGNMWFTEAFSHYIGRVTPRGRVDEFSVGPRIDAYTGIAAGADGNLWFSMTCVNSIGRSTPTGVITMFHIPGTARDAGRSCPGTL